MIRFKIIFYYFMLILLISADICEFPRLVFPTLRSHGIVNYIFLPIYLITILNFGIIKTKLHLPSNFIFLISLLLGPIILSFIYEYFLQSFLLIDNSLSRLRSIDTLLLLIFLLLSNVLVKQYYRDYWLKMLLKPYVLFCFFTSISGVIVFLLIVFNIINVENWSIPPIFQIGGEFAGNKLERTRMPLYITFVSKELFVDSGLYRFSGLSHEPNVYAMFTAPSLFFVSYVFQEWSFRKKSMAVGIILFHLMLTISIMFYAVIAAIALIIIFRNLLIIDRVKIRRLALILTSTVIMIIIFSNYINFLSLYGSIQDKITFSLYYSKAHINNLMSLFNAPVIVGTGFLGRPGPHNQWGLLSFLTYSSIWIFSVFTGLRLYFSRRRESTIGLGIVCYMMLLLKVPGHAFLQSILIYLLFITALSLTQNLLDKEIVIDL